MPKGGRRYHLLLYSKTLNRWWKYSLALALILAAFLAAQLILPDLFPNYPALNLSKAAIYATGGASGFALLLAILFIVIRKWAYVKPYPAYLHVFTPLLQFNISYQRIRQASSVEMDRLFPIQRYKGWRRKFLMPLKGRTAIVLEMIGWPLSPSILKVFLSPFFFPDNSPRLALLVSDWIRFSTEMESFRSTWQEAQRQATGHQPSRKLVGYSSKNR